VTEPSRAHTDWLVLAGFCGFLFFFGLAAFGLIGADEPRYAQVAREMLARHDWITPTLGGKPWLEKPPLYYWQAIVAYGVFGVSDWTARLPSAVDATLMAAAIYLFLQRFRPGSQLDGALMTASAAGIVGFSRAASMDMALTATFTIALLAWYGWRETGSRSYLAGFYSCLALGALAKGPVAPLLALIVIGVFALFKRQYTLITTTLWIPGIALFCLVTFPWYVAVQLRNPDFFRIFILEHNLARFGTNLYHHPEPFWYYLPVILLGLVPWTVFAIAALAKIVVASRKKDGERSADDLSVFLLVWLIVPIVFFSFSKSKLPGYIVPALPAGALLVSEYLRRQKGDDDYRAGWVLSCLHGTAASWPILPALMMQYILLQHRLPWGAAAIISAVFALVLAAGIAATLRTQHGVQMLRFVTLVPVVLCVAAVLRIGAPALDSVLSARPLAAELAHVQKKPMPLAVLWLSRETEFGLAFYRNETIARYEAGQIPAEEHLVLAPEGSQTALAKKTAGRRVSYLGSYAPQGIDYYWVAAAPGP